MAILFSRIFSFVIYRFLHAIEPCVIAFFPFRLRHLENMVLSNYVGSEREQIFFMAKCLCNILYMLVELMTKDASILQYVT